MTDIPLTYVRNPEDNRWVIDQGEFHAVACTAGYACDDEQLARRLASSHNACAGLPIEFLESGGVAELVEALHELSAAAAKSEIRNCKGAKTAVNLLSQIGETK